MNISTFKDNNYKDMDKISLFHTIISKGKKIPLCVYNCGLNPKPLLSLARSLTESKNNFQKLFDTTISDIEFFQIYKQFYRWDNDAIIANMNEELFPNPTTTTIKTNDVTSIIRKEGHGKDFSWWTVWNHSAYKVMVNGDFHLEDRIYTKQEISQLVKAGKLIVLKTDIPYGKEIDVSEAKKIQHNLSGIEINTHLHHKFVYYGHAIELKDIIEMHKTNPKAIPAIRRDLTPERLKHDYERFNGEYEQAMTLIDSLLERALKKLKAQYAQEITPIEDYLQSRYFETKPQTTTPTPTPNSEMAE